MGRLQALESDDEAFLRTTIEAHVRHTDSAVGQRILDGWDSEVSRFKRVMPVDYQRVLTVMQEAKDAGLDEEQTLAKVMEASRG